MTQQDMKKCGPVFGFVRSVNVNERDLEFGDEYPCSLQEPIVEVEYFGRNQQALLKIEKWEI